MPSPGRLWGGTTVRFRPSNCSAPVASVKPMMVRTVVVFPAPLRPMRAAHTPGASSKVTLRSTCAPAIDTLTLLNASMLSDPDHMLTHQCVLQHFGGRGQFLNLARTPHGNAAGIALDHIHIVLDEHRSHLLLGKRSDQNVHDAE